MPSVVFIQPQGKRESVEIKAGDTVMDAALDNGIAGIKAQCAGGITCSTCHCYVEEPWVTLLPEAVEDEKVMLEYVFKPQANSRLSCQIVVTEELNGIVVRIPEKQL